MRRISDKTQTGKEEIEDGNWEINRGSDIYMSLKLLESHLRQIGFKDHELQIAKDFIFVLDADREDKKYVWWRKMEKRVLKHLGISVSHKEFERCVDRISESIDSGELDLRHASN